MSKNVKYISSTHFGAPQLLGDRYGYGIEVLRKSLCEGFNQRTDVTSIRVISTDTLQITFLTPHNYVPEQTIAVSGLSNALLNDEYVVAEVTELTVTVNPYDNAILAPYVNLTSNNLNGVSTIVAPLGFIEKFRDGDHSIFTTDEEEAFFGFNDNEPTNWPKTNANRQGITPAVYMTDNATSLTQHGRLIVPYDAAFPTGYYTQFQDGAFFRNGIWGWHTFGPTTSSGNTPAQQLMPCRWTIIGNGRMFYFLPNIYLSASIYYTLIYMFGKFNNQYTKGHKNYALLAYQLPTNRHYYESTNFTIGYNLIPSTYIDTANRKAILNKSNLFSILSDAGSTNYLTISPTKLNAVIHTSNDNTHQIPGNIVNPRIQYPDATTRKFYISTCYANTGSGHAGKFSGIKWPFNVNQNIHLDNYFYYYRKSDNTLKKLYSIVTTATYTGVVAATTPVYYFISMDSKDWYNYD